MNKVPYKPDAYLTICMEPNCMRQGGGQLMRDLTKKFGKAYRTQQYYWNLQFIDHHVCPPLKVIAVGSACQGLCDTCPAARVIIPDDRKPDFYKKINCPSASVETILNTIRDHAKSQCEKKEDE